MKTSILSRRLLASAAGMAIGLSGALAAGSAAQAQHLDPVMPPLPPIVDPIVIPPDFNPDLPHVPGIPEFPWPDLPPIDTTPTPEEPGTFPLCDGLYVILVNPDEHDFGWSITLDGAEFWPGDGAGIGENEMQLVFVPGDAGDIVAETSHPEHSFPLAWDPPAGCAELDEPTVTQPTCDVDTGEIGIPGLPGDSSGDSLERSSAPAEAPTPQGLYYTLDDDDVTPESTHTVDPGQYVVRLNLDLGDALPGGVVLVIKTWVIDIVAADCPPDDPEEEPGTEPDEPEKEELAATGSPTAWIAGGALLLLTLGGAMYFVARRRGVVFTT